MGPDLFLGGCWARMSFFCSARFISSFSIALTLVETDKELCHHKDSKLLQLDLMAIVALHSIALQNIKLDFV